ncbi:MAG: hypothetical protein V1821_01850 [bacterium]
MKIADQFRPILSAAITTVNPTIGRKAINKAIAHLADHGTLPSGITHPKGWGKIVKQVKTGTITATRGKDIVTTKHAGKKGKGIVIPKVTATAPRIPGKKGRRHGKDKIPTITATPKDKKGIPAPKVTAAPKHAGKKDRNVIAASIREATKALLNINGQLAGIAKASGFTSPELISGIGKNINGRA